MSALREALGRRVRWLAGWLIPHKPYGILQSWRREAGAANAEGELKSTSESALIAGNRVLRNAHSGDRCFVLCNGPSVLRQDLSLLEGETVISVSSGYHHPLFSHFRPRYHCLPQVTYGLLTEKGAAAWLREMDTCLGDAELILNCTEERLVREYNLFRGRTVRYVWLSEDTDQIPGREIPDLTAAIPSVQSVSIMCLMVAMYMGFRTIYLLGVDHDQFKTGEYKYFYSPTVLHGKDNTVSPEGQVRSTRYDEFQALARLWRQYRYMREVATAHGIEIFNATAGGELDEFPRVEFESLFKVAQGEQTRAR